MVEHISNKSRNAAGDRHGDNPREDNSCESLPRDPLERGGARHPDEYDRADCTICYTDRNTQLAGEQHSERRAQFDCEAAESHYL